MRRILIAGNWKLNKTISQAIQLVKEIKEKVSEYKVEVLVCPVFTVLNEVNKIIKDSSIKLGAQDVYWKQRGAWTGEVSPELLKDVGCEYVIIGHSERRAYFGETDETVNRKIRASIDADLKAIMCIGEKLEERENGKTFEVVEKQLTGGLQNLNFDNISDRLVIAYEPVWAIGTGRTATAQQAGEVHRFIRDCLKKSYSEEADSLRILYGGSVKPQNIEELIKVKDIDGALVGGASLKSDFFSEIINISNNNT